MGETIRKSVFGIWPLAQCLILFGISRAATNDYLDND